MDDTYKKKIDDIHDALLGDEYHPEGGLIHKVNKIEKRVNKHEKIIGIGFGAIGVVAFLVKFWNDLKTFFVG